MSLAKISLLLIAGGLVWIGAEYFEDRNTFDPKDKMRVYSLKARSHQLREVDEFQNAAR